jgi:hypothetical protein
MIDLAYNKNNLINYRILKNPFAESLDFIKSSRSLSSSGEESINFIYIHFDSFKFKNISPL